MKTIKLIILIFIMLPCSAHKPVTKNLYFKIASATTKPNYEVFEMAMKGYFKLVNEGKLSRAGLITIIDFSLSSNKKRLWIIDLDTKKVIMHSLVAHGRNSGNILANQFSNKKGSFQSSLGFYVTGDTYYGKHGLSLYLFGKEQGFNDHALERAIVIHGASYVSREFIEKFGRLGRSYGCPAVPMEQSKSIIDIIKGGSCLFIYYPDTNYIEKSQLLNFRAF